MVSRRLLLSASLLAAAALPTGGCADGGRAPAARAPAPDYSYLNRLPLLVADIDFDDQAPAGGAAAEALLAMGRQRLVAAGGDGRAVFTVSRAEIAPTPEGWRGRLRVRLDILSGDAPLAWAEASVSRAGPASDASAASDLLRRMMEDMNVEFEFQARHALAAWLATGGTQPGPARAPDPAEP